MTFASRLHAAVERFRYRKQIAGRPEIRKLITNPWHAVSVVTGLEACAAALTLRDKRMLSGEAPTLPLAQCSNPKACTCRFRHHEDRRADPRRARDVGLPNREYREVERRGASRGRRATDIETTPVRSER